MRNFRSFIALLAGLMLVSCTAGQETQMPTAELSTMQATAVVLATDTTIPPTATLEATTTQETVVADTPVPATETVMSEVVVTETVEVTITPTLVLPPIPGRIAYLWSPEFSIGESPLTYNLNFAVPGSTPAEWQIQTALSGLSAQFMFPSPDQSRLALTQYKNVETGELGYSRFGGNTFDVYVYELADGSFTKFTENHFEQYPEVSWLPNNRELTFPMNGAIWHVNLNDSSIQQLVGGFSGSLYDHSWSPDGQWLAILSARSEEDITYDPNKLDIFNTDLSTLLPVISAMGQGDFIWSPNSQWLAFTKSIESGLFVLDLSTFTVTELPLTEYDYTLAAWSSDNQLIAVFKNLADGTTSLYFWNSSMATTAGSISSGDIRSLHWSPNNSQVMLTVYEEEQAKLVLFSVSDTNTQELFVVDRISLDEREDEFEYISELQGLSWSPDGQWFLFYAEPEGKAGLYAISKEGGDAYLVVETGVYSFDSRRAIWLSE